MKSKVHFIGIGGIGMSAIARILNRQGYKITGSDEKESLIIKEMQAEGIKCYIGHNEERLGNCNIVVYSSSIKENNVELQSARKRGLAVMHRAEILSEMIDEKISIAITGTHGKTTTTAILALIFEKAGMRPTAAIGGEVLNFQSNALHGKGDYFILEADESDGSFLKFYPDCAVLLNIDREHFDYFKNIDNAIDFYRRFIENVKKDGTVYYNADDRNLNRLLDKYRKRCVSFGTIGHPEVKAVDIRQSDLKMHFKCIINGKVIPEEFTFPVPGHHNVTNALAAIAVAYNAGIDFRVIKDALACYKGTKRRFEIKNTSHGIMLVEDYAHHPIEIEAVLRACEPLKKRLIVVFQPHRYTRTKNLFNEFINCFRLAEHVILTDIYAASEKAMRGVTTKRLFLGMKRSGIKNVEYIRKDAISRRVKDIAEKDDMVLVLGAGDINDVAKELSSGRSPDEGGTFHAKSIPKGTEVKQDIRERIKGRVIYNEPMKRRTSFRIGGPADIWIEPEDIDDLKNCIQLNKDKDIPLFIIGRGTNLLVKDEGVRGIVVNMSSTLLKNIYCEERRVSVTSSVTLHELLNFCCNKGLGGLEFLAGIPGSVGGAVMTNAGARHYEKIEKWHSVGDSIEEIKIMNYNGEIDVLSKKELFFGYKSLDLTDRVILEVKFLLTRATREDILNECQKFLKRKKETQEMNVPSAGCIFKNPPGFGKSAGELIDRCNLKGARIGGAVISRKHSNFIVNSGNASSTNVMALIDMVREKVKDRFGVELSLEIKII